MIPKKAPEAGAFFLGKRILACIYPYRRRSNRKNDEKEKKTILL